MANMPRRRRRPDERSPTRPHLELLEDRTVAGSLLIDPLGVPLLGTIAGLSLPQLSQLLANDLFPAGAIDRAKPPAPSEPLPQVTTLADPPSPNSANNMQPDDEIESQPRSTDRDFRPDPLVLDDFASPQNQQFIGAGLSGLTGSAGPSGSAESAPSGSSPVTGNSSFPASAHFAASASSSDSTPPTSRNLNSPVPLSDDATTTTIADTAATSAPSSPVASPVDPPASPSLGAATTTTSSVDQPTTGVDVQIVDPSLPSDQPDTPIVQQSASMSIGFEHGLADWTIDVVGGTEQGKGSVTQGSAILREGDSFLVTLKQSFVVPENPAPLVFRFTELDFDTTDRDSINDAFEASLVDASGRTLVHTYVTQRDAFFNVTEGVAAALGSGVTHDIDVIETVTVDLSGVSPGTTATVEFRLVNNDQDTETSVRILDVTVPTSNAPPQIAPLADLIGFEGATVTVQASFTDSDLSDTHTAGIDWGDGTTTPAGVSEAGGQGTVMASHVYADNADYAIRVVVRDNVGAAAERSATARIANEAPIATGSDFSAVRRTPFSRLLATFSDQGFTSSLAGTAETFTATIDWGDGGPTDQGTVTTVPGAAGTPTTGTVSGSHSYASPGMYDVTVSVTDDNQGTGQARFRITVDANGGTKFFLVDGADKGTFRYDAVGNSIDRKGLTSLNSAPRGIASTVAGDTVWVIDAARRVYVYSADGAPLGNWTAGNLYQPTDITTDGTDIWIVDDGRNMVFRYANAASRRSSHQGPVSSFALPSDNLNPSGIVTDGNLLWITEDGPSLNRVFVYNLAGQKLGSWDLDPANGAPSGITLDPSGGDPGKNLWVVDRDDAMVYRYANATPLRGGSQVRADSFALAASNLQPEGIADPPIEFNAVDSRADLLQSYVLTPLRFEANQGQTDEQVQFLSRGPGYSLSLMPTEAVLTLPQPVTGDEAGVANGLSPSVVRMQLVGADSAAAIVGQHELPGRVNYFIGNDPAQWQTDVPTYDRVHYDDVYPGVDLIYYGNQQQLEYDFVVAPYADPSLITLRFSEVQGFEIVDNGDLILHATTGDVVQRAPILYQDVNGIRESIEGAYVRLGDDQVGFEIGAYDTSLELVIDPILAVSSYFGGTNY